MHRLVIIVFGLLLSATPALAQTPVATILAVEGQDALILRGATPGTAEILRPDATIMVGDVIQTGSAGRAIVFFRDETRMTLGENARLRIENYIYDDEQPAGNSINLEIAQGAFLYVAGKMLSEASSNIKIMTPVGILSPRAGDSAPTGWGGLIEQDYSVYADNGEFSFETQRGRVRLAKGEGAAIRSMSAIPMRPAPWLPEKVTAAKDMIGLKDITAARSALEKARAQHAGYLLTHRDESRATRSQRVEELQARPNQRRIDMGDLQAVKNMEPAISPATPQAEPVAETLPEAEIVPAPIVDEAIEDVILEGADTAPARAPQTVTEMEQPAVAPAIAPAPMDMIEPPQEAPIPATDVIRGEPALVPAAPAFPTPPQNNITVDLETLPTDPAMRQEALEKMALPQAAGQQEPQAAEPDPFGGPSEAPAKVPDPF